MARMKNSAGTCALLLLTTLSFWPAAAMPQMQVRVAPVVSAPIVEQLPLSGSVLSLRYSDLTTQVSGLVVAVEVDVGDRGAETDVGQWGDGGGRHRTSVALCGVRRQTRSRLPSSAGEGRRGRVKWHSSSGDGSESERACDDDRPSPPAPLPPT